MLPSHFLTLPSTYPTMVFPVASCWGTCQQLAFLGEAAGQCVSLATSREPLPLRASATCHQGRAASPAAAPSQLCSPLLASSRGGEQQICRAATQVGVQSGHEMLVTPSCRHLLASPLLDFEGGNREKAPAPPPLFPRLTTLNSHESLLLSDQLNQAIKVGRDSP